ncbi:amino acid ABC transporter membrane protein (PAAT family) [Haloactinospora alba]|uniref:Amino acid ABC transporter membrane protein (PAAT family) n=1 Tax=Haloactinospora alba TaxID=405555 RepID=A0A543NFC4_9ACTN|nr:amino acid ABC transporter permease [Haloactinospora alba]TQN30532.1 amino acid ABC transporter membrane protein (PAAT family) [Haloactinospora alba]
MSTAPASTSPPPDRESAEELPTVPVRHPGRWVAAAVLLVLAAMFVHMLVTNPAFNWPFLLENMFSSPVLTGVRTTVILAALSMTLGVVIGIAVAVMRLSANPVLVSLGWLYTWFFRAVPRLVLCVVAGNLGVLYKQVEFGLPFDNYWMPLLGFREGARFFSVPMNDLLTPFLAALLALALSQGAYMAEIVRAGLLSVPRGQTEAAQALGMSQSQVLRRITLPQALRVIVPPTGNEATAILKDTSLVSAIPLTTELFFQLQAVGNRTFDLFPMLVAACLWYLAMVSVMMLGQNFLERSFSKGDRQVQTKADTTGSSEANQ